MKTIKVIAAGYSTEGKSMGDLVNEGIMKKSYETGYMGPDIIWHLKKDAGVIVDNGYDVMYPGDTVKWEK